MTQIHIQNQGQSHSPGQSHQDAESPQVPRWVGVMVAVVLVGGFVGGGALWALTQFMKPNPAELTEVDAPIQARIAAQIRAQPPPSDGITQPRPGTYQVRAGEVLMFATKPANAADWSLRCQYNKSDLVPVDQLAALTARLRLANDTVYAKFLKVTDDQIAKLKEIPAVSNVGEMVLSPDDQARIKALWTQYIAAPKPDLEQTIVKSLQEMGQRSLAPTRAAITARADKIKTILSAEQIAPFKT
jgi:hypothetical protein